VIQFHQNAQPMVKWILLAFVLCGLFGCSSVAMNFTPIAKTNDQFTIRVFKGTQSDQKDESVIEPKAKEYAEKNGYASYEILPVYSIGYGQPVESDGLGLAFTIIGAQPQRYFLYTVQFKR
jgi:hypothetical protein